MFRKPQNNFKYQPYSKAKLLIREADILLFRGRGISSFFIKKASRGRHSHAAVASWKYGRKEHGIFEPLLLATQVQKYSGTIDVFRPSRRIQIFDDEHLDGYWVDLNPLEITNCMRKMTGLPYGWSRMFKLAGVHFLGFRLANTINVDDEWVANTYPVCSTAVSRSIRKGYSDPVHWLADSHTEPPDLARSSMLNYIFTLVDDGNNFD